MWECANGLLGRIFPKIGKALAWALAAPLESGPFHRSVSSDPAHSSMPVSVDYWDGRTEFLYFYQRYICRDFLEGRGGDRARPLVPTSFDRDRGEGLFRAGLPVSGDFRWSSRILPTSPIVVRRSRKFPLIYAAGP